LKSGEALANRCFFSWAERPGKDAAKRLTDRIAARSGKVVGAVEDSRVVI
jgi:hypothetical protein